jgi:trehalose 6-phosphate phosphatase
MHGFERRDAQGHCMRPAFEPYDLENLRLRLSSALRPLDGVIIEDKHFGMAVHYRLAPQLEAPLRAILKRMEPLIPPGHELLEGDHVIEIKPNSHNKATAIEAFMQEPPFAGRVPVFIGDDITDQDGFAAVRRHQGLAIGVGEITGTEWRLESPSAVRRWLESLLLQERVA